MDCERAGRLRCISGLADGATSSKKAVEVGLLFLWLKEKR